MNQQSMRLNLKKSAFTIKREFPYVHGDTQGDQGESRKSRIFLDMKPLRLLKDIWRLNKILAALSRFMSN